jgi:hypothetical protein
MAAPAAAAKGLELAFLVDPAVLAQGPHFWGDATRLRQVLHHLVSNAVKYSDSGEVVVRATLAGGSATNTTNTSSSGSGVGMQEAAAAAGAAAGAGPPPSLAISVRDAGIGMSPDLQSGLFQSFRQGSDALDRRYGGTGLGLALSKRLAEAMGGDILVESALGTGSTFTLVLHPAWCAEGDEGGEAAEDEGAGAGACSSSTLSSAAESGAWRAPAGSSGDLSAGSGHGSPAGAAAAAAARRNSLGSARPSSVSSDLDGEGCICGCAQAHAHARAQLAGRTVRVDVAPPLLAEQACQILAQLGLRPLPVARPAAADTATAATAAAAATDNPASPAAAAADRADMAVVSPCRVADALRSGWRGRPLIVVGSPDEVPERLHPLVVAVGQPLRLGRLVAALQRAAGMLSWQGGAENAPRLGPLQPAAAAGAAPGGHALPQALAGGARGERQQWRQGRASIDNSALRQSPMSAAPLGAAPHAPQKQQQQQQQQQPPPPALPPPLDLAGPGGIPQSGKVLRLVEAVKTAFSARAAAAPEPGRAEACPPAEPPQLPAAARRSGSFTGMLRPPPASKPPPAPAQQEQQEPPKPLHILIAEDNRVSHCAPPSLSV